MATLVRQGGSYNFKQVVKQNLDTYNMTFDVEAEFFINLITQYVNYKILQRKKHPYYGRSSSLRPDKRKEEEKKIENAYNIFSKKLIENVSGKKVTTHDLYITMNGLCPMWPFC